MRHTFMKRFILGFLLLAILLLATACSSEWNTPYQTIVSQGNTNPKNGTYIDPELFGKVLRVTDNVGGWFYFIAPKDGDYSFSVLAPDLNRPSFSIEVYEYVSETNKRYYCSLMYEKSSHVQTQTIRGVKAGMRICWWDNDGTGRGFTLTEPFSLKITYQGNSDS